MIPGRGIKKPLSSGRETVSHCETDSKRWTWYLQVARQTSTIRHWEGRAMEKARKRVTHKRTAEPLDVLQHALVSLQDDLTETMAWTALVCDGLCGILAESELSIDSTTHTGVRFAAIWLKQRNEKHAATLQAACSKLREIRGQ